MKMVVIFFLVFVFLPVTSAQISDNLDLSNVKSIDDFQLPESEEEASEEVLPYDEIQKLFETEGFTILSESRVRTLFSKLKRNPPARNRVAGGKCAIRRSYIQRYLRNLDIESGRLLINCPSISGHMRLIDQVTGRRYTFSNFHDVNVVSVPDAYQVLDVQFKSGPLSLGSYLAQVEASQKLKPLRKRSIRDRGYCYWSIK